MTRTLAFPLGRTVATPGAVAAFNDTAPLMLALDRHVACDWSEMPADDQQANRLAVLDGSRILGSYTVEGVRLWIITEADRSATTILLPEEY